MNIRTPLAKALHTTKDHLAALAEAGIHTVLDLLLYLPRAHEDLSAMHTVATAPIAQKISMRGVLTGAKLVYTKTRKQIVNANFTDSNGDTIECVWFNQPHIKRMIEEGKEVVLTGKLGLKGRKLQWQSPLLAQNRTADLVHAGRIVPVYPQSDILSNTWLREKIYSLKDYMPYVPETLPEHVVVTEGFISKAQAIEYLHMPQDGLQVKAARERLQFEELYNLQLTVLNERKAWQSTEQDRIKIPMDTELIRSFFESLHFTPTDGQRIAIFEILRDLTKGKPMSRLLEGDVGSGKTMVATAVMANVLRHGGQCALMVPTEVLARQHVSSIGKTLINFFTYLEKKRQTSSAEGVPVFRHPNIAVLTGSMPKSEADEVRLKLSNGSIDLVIGTHALIQDTVQFSNLQLVIIDEQHRFGVLQRERLQGKGSPHMLAMTATPIPRTLALTAYGQHDLSVLIEKPGNRKPIFTKIVPPKDRKTVELFIDQQITEGRQVFVVCPLITESENEDFAELKSVQFEAERLKQAFPKRRIAMLHGKMSANDKQTIMTDFKAVHYDILVSTSVIEVGIDVPNTTIIVIEGAERFGLSQLHQFRGRVGRGEFKSYCYLCTTNQEQAYSKRLKAMEEYDNGFQLAEIDLQLRGPGDLLGTRQSGLPDVSAESLMNPELVVRARRAAYREVFGAEEVPM